MLCSHLVIGILRVSFPLDISSILIIRIQPFLVYLQHSGKEKYLMLDDLGNVKYFLLALLHMKGMFLTLFAAERSLTDLTEVPGSLERGRAAQTDGFGLLQ